jgi:hypothetical protein
LGAVREAEKGQCQRDAPQGDVTAGVVARW